MIMNTKAAQLKQTLCFRSLRLMDKNYLKTNLKSFSDSEIDEKECLKPNNFRKLKKYSSENCLLFQIIENESNHINSSPCINETNKLKDKSYKITKANSSEIMKNSNCGRAIYASSADQVSSSELKQRKTETETNPIKNQGDQISNPYQVLKSTSTSEVVNENLLGEPRCLALKKYRGDFNPFLTDDSLIFEPDFEEDNFELDEKMKFNIKKFDVNANSQIKDMFVDEEEAISCEKKNPTVDREEGELSPEIHKPVLAANKENNSSTKLNVEFFHKINDCLLDLDKKCREFYDSSTPEAAMKYLQRTLSNVDSIKRKLTFLISSKNSEIEKKRKLRKIVEKYYVSEKDSAQNSKTKHSKSNRKSSERASGFSGSYSHLDEQKSGKENSSDFSSKAKDKDVSHRSDEVGKKMDENNHEKNVEDNLKYGHRKRNSRDKLTQAYLLNRKKVDILEKLGTKKEIQRIKSLFERQMSLITKHVIQEKEASKGHHNEKYRRHHSSQKETNKNKEPHEKIDLSNLQTLEDMEAFLNTLKTRTNDKVLSEQFIRNEKKKKLLMFTSKRDTNADSMLRSDKTVSLSPAFKSVNSSKTVLENFSNKESSLAEVPNHQNSQTSDSIQFKENEVDSELISNDKLSKESHYTKDRLKDTCSKTLVPITSAQLPKKKTSEQVKSDSEKRNNGDFDQTNLIKDVLVLKHDKNSKKATEANSTKEPRHKSKHSHRTHDIDQKEIVKRKRKEELGSKVDEPEAGEDRQTIKRKRIEEYLTSLEKPQVITNNLGIENTQSNLELESEKIINEASDSLIKDLFSKKIFILDDNNLVKNNQFCIKVINNEIYLKKISSRHKHKRSRSATKPHDAKKNTENLFDNPCLEENIAEKSQDIIDAESTNLEDMENFLQELRSKKKVTSNTEKQELTSSNPQCKESKFLAKIRAKRKAKLMACVSDGANATEKEAKFLKSLEKREDEISDSSDIESRKRKLMQKMRAEVDAIVFAEKPSTKLADDDPLRDVKTFLNMIKEAESVNDESSKQVYVSFSLKRSDVKKLESLTSGKSSSLTEESQKFLNSVRAKMRAKKAPVSNINPLMQKPED